MIISVKLLDGVRLLFLCAMSATNVMVKSFLESGVYGMHRQLRGGGG